MVQRQPGEVGGKLIVNLNRSEEHIRCKGEQSWENSPKPLNGTASLGAWGKLLDGDYFFFIFCEQPLDKLSQLGFVLGQGSRLVDFVGGQNKGTSGDKEENEDKFFYQYCS